MQEQNTNAGQGLGIAGLVMGVLAIPLGIIPCTFFIALVFGAMGIVLSAIALSQANRGNGPGVSFWRPLYALSWDFPLLFSGE
jgi:hypothetical protein